MVDAKEFFLKLTDEFKLSDLINQVLYKHSEDKFIFNKAT